MGQLGVSEGAFSAPAQCVEEVRALVSVASEGEVAICNGCLPVCVCEGDSAQRIADASYVHKSGQIKDLFVLG